MFYNKPFKHVLLGIFYIKESLFLIFCSYMYDKSKLPTLITRRISKVEQELITLRERFWSSQPICSVHVVQSLVFCFLFSGPLLVFSSLVLSDIILPVYLRWLSLWKLNTFLERKLKVNLQAFFSVAIWNSIGPYNFDWLRKD